LVGAALMMFSPFTPMLFMGEDWGASTPFRYFTDHKDIDLAQAVRDGRRRELAAFGWKPEEVPDPQDLEAFRASKRRWAERAEQHHARVLAWHRAWVALRRSHASLMDGRLDGVRAVADDSARTLVVRRGALCLIVNLGPAQRVALPERVAGRVLLASPRPSDPGVAGIDVEVVELIDGGRAVRLAADAVAVLSLGG
jgi:maltooligosyltrehalose trehalohydrolase